MTAPSGPSPRVCARPSLLSCFQRRQSTFLSSTCGDSTRYRRAPLRAGSGECPGSPQGRGQDPGPRPVPTCAPRGRFPAPLSAAAIFPRRRPRPAPLIGRRAPAPPGPRDSEAKQGRPRSAGGWVTPRAAPSAEERRNSHVGCACLTLSLCVCVCKICVLASACLCTSPACIRDDR